MLEAMLAPLGRNTCFTETLNKFNACNEIDPDSVNSFSQVIIFVNALSLYTVGADRTSLKIYVEITGHAGCFRRFNATHQIGCSCEYLLLYVIMRDFENKSGDKPLPNNANVNDDCQTANSSNV